MFELVPAKITGFGQPTDALPQPAWPTRLLFRLCAWFINQTIRRHRSLETGISLIEDLRERLNEQTTENDRLVMTLNSTLKAAETAQEELGMLRVALGISQRRYFELLAGRDTSSLTATGNSLENGAPKRNSTTKRKNTLSSRKKSSPNKQIAD